MTPEQQEALRILIECAEHYADPKIKLWWLGNGRAQHALDKARKAGLIDD